MEKARGRSTGYRGINTILVYRSLILREELRLRVFENRVLRGIFGSKRDEVTGEWRTSK
jgi:hypothetical protein